MPAILPGIKPTGRKVAVPTVVIVGFDQDNKITHEHIYWDQATMLVQLGLLDPSALPVTGAEQAAAADRSNASLQHADPEIGSAALTLMRAVVPRYREPPGSSCDSALRYHAAQERPSPASPVICGHKSAPSLDVRGMFSGNPVQLTRVELEAVELSLNGGFSDVCPGHHRRL